MHENYLFPILYILTTLLVESLIIMFLSNKLFDSELNYKDSLIICSKKFLILLSITLGFALIGGAFYPNAFIMFCLVIVFILSKFVLSSYLYGIMIKKINGDNLGFKRGLALFFMSGYIWILFIGYSMSLISAFVQ